MPLVYFDLNWGINQGSDCEKIPNGKTIKILWVFVLQKYGKFGSVQQSNFIKHKTSYL